MDTRAAKMKWAFLHPGEWERMSGGYVYDRALVHALESLGEDVALFGLAPNAPTEEIRRIGAAISEHNPTVMLQDQLSFPSLTRLNTNFSARIPTIGLVHVPSGFLTESLWQRRHLKRQERHYATTLDAALFVSEPTAQESLSYLNWQKPWCVLPPGRDHVTPHHQGTSTGDTLRLLFAGRLAPEKGLGRLMEFLAKLSPKLPWQLTVASTLSKEELQRVYAETDFLMLPSPYESFSLVALEAMAHGVPVVSWAKGGPTSFIHHGKNGLRFETGQNAANVKYFEEICRDPMHRQAMRAAARATYQTFPTWETVARRLIAFVREEVTRVE